MRRQLLYIFLLYVLLAEVCSLEVGGGSRVDKMIFGSPVHLVNFVMDLPLMNPLSVKHKKTIIKAGARILDTIWKLRNRAVHDGVIPI